MGAPAEKSMLEQIAAWPLDAEDDNIGRYHLPAPAASRIAQGEASLVLGPPGAGKTALATYLARAGGYGGLAKTIALTEALTGALRGQHGPSSAGADAAELLIFLAAFEALVDSRVLQGSAIRDLAPLLALDIPPRTLAALPLAFTPSIIEEVFGHPDAPRPRAALNDGLPRARVGLARLLGERAVLVLIDEAPTRAGARRTIDALRVDVLADFLGAMETIARVGPAAVRPVMFTREGLFGALEGEVAQTWRPRRLDLAWSEEELFQVAAFRCARAASAEFAEGEFQPGSVLRRVFQAASRDMGEGAGRREGPWHHIWRRTRARPRDAIHYLRAAARAALETGADSVNAHALRRAEAMHAAYLHASVIEELSADFPDVEAALDALAEIGAGPVDPGTLNQAMEAALARRAEGEATAGARRAIELLFAASAIGNVVEEGGRKTRSVFRHLAPEAQISWADPFQVHPGLWALSVRGA